MAFIDMALAALARETRRLIPEMMVISRQTTWAPVGMMGQWEWAAAVALTATTNLNDRQQRYLYARIFLELGPWSFLGRRAFNDRFLDSYYFCCRFYNKGPF